MSYYIKQAISLSEVIAFYIGKSRLNPTTQRGNPMNKDIAEWIKNHGQISWRTLMVIPDHELHSEFGESYLINCFKKKLSQFKLFNKAVPHSMAMVYDSKSDLVISKLKNLIV
jgi:hypothetical protein